ncbi:unnamed protein product [Fraxinus pennsylvanica]|uniref:Glycosyltransferase family 92 protein n=1 Tax=Fraxinus pennsylvanica TaxID=56036 RepID=A0AAD2A671_9LAMI|nr:unnamed protein product [Fraxinus pennsylvanica]
MNNLPEKDRDRKMLVGIVWNCAAEAKLLLTALLFLCSLATVFLFLSSRFSVFPSDLRHYLAGTPTGNITTSSSVLPDLPSVVQLLQQQQKQEDQLLENGIIKRAFNSYGSVAYNFVLMSAYRGGANTFAAVGLSSKPLHVFGKPSYQCQWIPHEDTDSTVTTAGQKILPDWGFGRVYTIVIVNCTFPTPTGGKGGKLLIHATTNGGGDTSFNITDSIVVLKETPEEIASFTLQCNSQPKYRFAAKWMLFFDLDEFIFMPKKSTIQSVFDSLSDFTQFNIEQMPMSNKLCLSQDARSAFRKWGFEKLVYEDVKRGKTTYKTEGCITYFHYHGTIAERREPCRQLVNSTQVTVDGIPYVLDTTMRDIAGIVKRFELKMIGSRLQKTRQ